MYGIKGIRFAVRMAPTPEQIKEIKAYFDKQFIARGMAPKPNAVLYGWQNECLVTVDEALEMFTMAKQIEDSEAEAVETKP
jgi:hypothetical protein